VSAELLSAGLEAIGQALSDGRVRAIELVEASLAEAEAQAALGAFLRLDPEGARAAAVASDARRAAGAARGPWDGVPVAVKDNFVTEGLETTAGSRILQGWIPPYDATVVARLRAAGAVIVGKTRLDEFGMGSSTEHTVDGPCRNPWDPTRVAGGSSGGSAVAVAAGIVPVAFGTDTGGSIRQPAALCGVHGLKPTYGRVSRFGIVAFASSLDQVGPFARHAADLAAATALLSGRDLQDATTSDRPPPGPRDGLDAGVEGLRIGVPEALLAQGLDAEVEASVRGGLAELAAAGAELVPIALPHVEHALSAYYVIATAEASSNLARYDGVRYGRRIEDTDLRRMITRSRHAGFGDEVQRRILLGTFVLSAGFYDAYYAKAQRARTLVRRDFEQAFERCDLIATAVTPTPAFPLGDKLDDPLAMYRCDVLTLPASLAGVPALSTPLAPAASGLPIGLQLAAPWFEEARLWSAAAVLEARTGHANLRPPRTVSETGA
jgi:aspartyl-tRNA(Asn)/glutamyl-tRNA(Gln) amidotransferase subunit A